jgi:hypothetical protein
MPAKYLSSLIAFNHRSGAGFGEPNELGHHRLISLTVLAREVGSIRSVAL